MTMNSNTMSKKSTMKPFKIARFVVDILGVYKSDSSSPIPFEEAMTSLKQRFSSKPSPKVKKCILEILHNPNDSCQFIFKSKDKTKIMETFTLDSIGAPVCCQLAVDKYKTESLVLLPILNQNRLSELFVFHPYSVSAQDVVIRIASLLESHKKRKANNRRYSSSIINQTIHNKPNNHQTLNNNITNNNMVNDNPPLVMETINHIENHSLPKTEFNDDQDDNRSLCSISSNFINNWFGKITLTSLQPNSVSSLASVNDELSLLNQNLKEIRGFMNELFQIVHVSVNQRKKNMQKQQKETNHSISQVIQLPSKQNFIEIIKKIKQCFNLAVIHENIIFNPLPEDIVNQLFLFLRILGDATINNSTGNPDLICKVKDPMINSSTVKFFTNHLSPENLKYWTILGPNFGYKNFRGSLPNNLDGNYFDEFQIRKATQTPEYEERFPALLSKNHESYQPSPLVTGESDLIYRTFNRHYEREIKTPLFLESENLPYRKPASRSPHSQCHIHTNHTTWDDRQCRFIDAVQLRNGKLGKVTNDRPVQNYRDLGVCVNEVVEILKDYGDVLSVKNALGEIGNCPKAIINEVNQYHFH